MKEMTVEHSHLVLQKMFGVMGFVYKPEIVKEQEWFLKHEWTPIAKEKFLTWLTDFLIKNKYATKSRARHEAEKIDADIGWKEPNT